MAAVSKYFSASQGANDGDPYAMTIGTVSNAAADVELRITTGNDTLSRAEAIRLAQNFLNRIATDPAVLNVL